MNKKDFVLLQCYTVFELGKKDDKPLSSHEMLDFYKMLKVFKGWEKRNAQQLRRIFP